MSTYTRIFDGIVSLGYMDRSLADFGHAVKAAILKEQAKLNPDNQLLNTLFDAARLGWEVGRLQEKVDELQSKIFMLVEGQREIKP